MAEKFSNFIKNYGGVEEDDFNARFGYGFLLVYPVKEEGEEEGSKIQFHTMAGGGYFTPHKAPGIRGLTRTHYPYW